MSKLPEPTLLELQGYEYYHSVPKFVVKYKEITLREDKKHTKKICHYGFFLEEEEARTHFFSLPKYYSWRQNKYAREFVKVVKLEEMKADAKKKKKKEPRFTDHLNKKDPLVKQLIKDRFGKKN
tara:strand:+ start:284 stop:655 length:372 start_codon:yes stop_codon:yes gene_type:complete